MEVCKISNVREGGLCSEAYIGAVDKAKHISVDVTSDALCESRCGVLHPVDSGESELCVSDCDRLDEVLVEVDEHSTNFVHAAAIVVSASYECCRSRKIVDRDCNRLARTAVEFSECVREQADLSQVLVCGKDSILAGCAQL